MASGTAGEVSWFICSTMQVLCISNSSRTYLKAATEKAAAAAAAAATGQRQVRQ